MNVEKSNGKPASMRNLKKEHRIRTKDEAVPVKSIVSVYWLSVPVSVADGA